MHQDQLIKGETVLSHSDNDIITLTTHRIRYRNGEWGQSNFISMMLEKISSVQVLYVSYPFFLIIGIILFIIGLLITYSQSMRSEGGIITKVIGAIFVIAYFVTRKHTCVIASDGGTKIIFRTEGINTETLINMMDKIEQAKSNRVSQLLIM